MSSAGKNPRPEALAQAARELEAIARELGHIASRVESYQLELRPLAGKVEQVVGGSATRRDRHMVLGLNDAARDIDRCAGSMLRAASEARRLAQQVASQASSARR